MRHVDTRATVVGVVGLVLAAVAVWALSSRSVPPAAGRLPEAAELDSLSRYLRPVGPAPRIDDYAAFLPARPTPAPVPAPQPVAQEPQQEWTLTAILIAGPRPVAIINDQAVAPGARLSDGTVVLTIESDHVLVRAPDGVRRRLFLTAG